MQTKRKTYDDAMRRASNEGRREMFGDTDQLIAFVCESTLRFNVRMSRLVITVAPGLLMINCCS